MWQKWSNYLFSGFSARKNGALIQKWLSQIVRNQEVYFGFISVHIQFGIIQKYFHKNQMETSTDHQQDICEVAEATAQFLSD